jgi:hypothetical protein
VRGSYTAQAPTPEPASYLATGVWCDPALETAKHERLFRIPYAGRLTVRLEGFIGDWSLGVYDLENQAYAASDREYSSASAVSAPEQVTIVFREAGTPVVLRACNLVGGPSATVRYEHRPL